jgi:hypothetical protein
MQHIRRPNREDRMSGIDPSAASKMNKHSRKAESLLVNSKALSKVLE